MKKLTITTSTKPQILNKVLAPYKVTVEKNEWGYKEMRFETEEAYESSFFTVMHHLLNHKIYVTVLDIKVSTRVYAEQAYILAATGWCKEDQFETSNYNNFSHRKRANIDLRTV